MSEQKPSSLPATVVRCPACGGPSRFAPDNTFRPFCGERCRQHDLGAWASERFVLPEHLQDNDPGFEQND